MIQWRTSSYSAGNGACVQVGVDGGGVPVRDSKDPDGPVLLFTQQQWAEFLLGIRDGEFNYTSG